MSDYTNFEGAETHDEDQEDCSEVSNPSAILSFNDLPGRPTRVFIYVLRAADPKADLKINVKFHDGPKFEFMRSESFGDKDKINPFIHIAEIYLQVHGKEAVFYPKKDKRLVVNQYELFIANTILRNYRDYRKRFINQTELRTHNFLFDVNFVRNRFGSPPGQNIDFWSQLCLYTYYLLHTNQFDLFDTLAKEFLEIVKGNKYHMMRDDLNNFFQNCSKYLSYALSNSSDMNRACTMIYYMIGLLNIDRNNLDFNHGPVCKFAQTVNNYFIHQGDHTFESVSNKYWPEVFKGSAALLLIQLITDKDINLAFLQKIKRDGRRSVLASFLLKQLVEFDQPVISTHWIILFDLVEPTEINLQRLKPLQLTRSIEVYFLALINILRTDKIQNFTIRDIPLHSDPLIFDDSGEDSQYFTVRDVPRHFDRLVSKSFLIVDLSSIVAVLNYSEKEKNENDPSMKAILHFINRIINESQNLRTKTREYLSTIRIHQDQLDQIRQILCFLDKSSLLFSLGKVQLMDNLFQNSKKTDNVDFIVKWFYTFLVSAEISNEANKQEYRLLLKVWSKGFLQQFDTFIEILKSFDSMIKAIENEQCKTIFSKSILKICFEQLQLFEVIERALIFIHDDKFLKPFRTDFADKFSETSPEVFKDLTNEENPLYRLRKIYRQTNGKVPLIKTLIENTCEKIELSSLELIESTFNLPSAENFVFQLMFDECFQSTKLRQKIFNGLAEIWKNWEEKGFFVHQIRTWESLDKTKRETVGKIWNLLGTVNKREYQIDALIREEQLKMQVIVQHKDEINKCLEQYCANASDLDDYKKHLSGLETQLKSVNIKLVEVSEELKKIMEPARRLNRWNQLHAWKVFLAKQRLEEAASQSNVSVTTDSNLNEEDLFDIKSLENPSFGLQSNSNRIGGDLTENLHADTRPCLTILQNYQQILELFKKRWSETVTKWRDVPIADLLVFFPDTKFIDSDFKIFQQSNSREKMNELKSILDYWKDRENINHICQGWLRLLDGQDTTAQQEIIKNVTDIPQIKVQTSGSDCFRLSQFYFQTFGKRYSKNLSRLLAEYDKSHDLIVFLSKLTLGDIESLRQAVNDWDETSINTKTILDVVLVKRFLVQFDEQLKLQGKQIDRSYFDRISNAFEETIKDRHFQNLIEAFRVSSACLTAVQRIYLELTDKESAKRKQISTLMRQMNFSFVQQSDQFDICFQSDERKFNELNELRDRARLIEHSIKNNNNNQPEESSRRNELEDFVRFVEIVEKVLKNLIQLNRAGYPNINDYLKPNKRFECQSNNYQEFIKFSQMLDDLLEEWQKHLCEMYKKHFVLTYFIDQQIWDIENYLYGDLEMLKKNHQGYHLLKFIDIDPKNIKPSQLPKKSAEANERLSIMGDFLTAQRTDSTATTNRQDKTTVQQVSLVETSDQGILRAILCLFKYFNVIPSVSHIFYCTNQTTWMEIRAFIYRCFLSQTLHQLIRPENLTAAIQDQFSHLVQQLIKLYSKTSFQLGIITTVSSSQTQLINALKALQIVQSVHDQNMLNDDDLVKMIKQMIGANATLVTSRISGLGKSHFIRQEILKKQQNYIKFPITGDLSIDEIASRLQELSDDLSSGKAALHIDVGAISHNPQFNEFLYCLLLFRKFRFGQLAIHIPANVSIFIELDSSPSYGKLYDRILVFKSMQQKRFDQIDWNDFDFPDLSKIQFIVNYLRALQDDSILEKDITKENMNKYNRDQCIETLKSRFSQETHPNFTWVQLSIFVSIYYRLFFGFSQCGYFLCRSLNTHVSLRKDLVEYLLQSASQFTSLSVEDVRRNQRSAFTKDLNQTFSESIVRWDKTQPFTLMFTASNDPIFVYKTPEAVPANLVQLCQNYTAALKADPHDTLKQFFPDYSQFTHQQFFQRLATLSNKFLNKSICTKCYRNYGRVEEKCKACPSGPALIRPTSLKTDDINRFQNTIAQLIETEYIFTPDNFIKMLLIYLRIQSRIPVLIMGETGCGKTALIQCLCQKILDDDMAIFRIHAGVTNEEIISNFKVYFDQAHYCEKDKKRLWVFLDEFNTTPNIGLIKEITCERTLLGEPLPDNLVLLGACNPQRQKKSTTLSNESQVGIKKDLYEIERLKKNSGVTLLYTVVPIPETMLEYVWDYGFLDSDIEMKYIRTMLNGCNRLKDNSQWFEATALVVSESQRFFREFEDVSSVSLRDVARFCRLYNWFRNVITSEDRQENVNTTSFLLERATIIPLLLCYYFRLNTPEDRKRYTDSMENHLKPVLGNLANNPNILIKLLHYEQDRWIQKMTLPRGTAKNRALMDNIFVLLVCIVNRIPVVLSGKPGCSKTSAVQIVISNLRGKSSSNRSFQRLPELMSVFYQGSQNCTSDSVIKVFQRADKYLDVKQGNKLLPVIVFDEIGLAELSPHNPLKVLHSKLEVETCQYGFVGLSNWRLDASKMNRALYLSCSEPTVEDLKLTATQISESIINETQTQTERIDNQLIENLAAVYHKLYDDLQTDVKVQQYANYFGLRDFYSLIKDVVKDLIVYADPFACIRRQLIINFDGVVNGSEIMWVNFCENMKREDLINAYPCPTFKELLDKRLQSRQGRYLMLIAENDTVIDYVERYIIAGQQSSPVRTLIGSRFENDLISGTTYTENYNCRVLMDVILYAETNTTLIMRRMGHLYDNLYDLFNQNFAIVGERQYCRIALGALYHPQCLVNDDFYCVVLMHKDDLATCDPPFLNRFEKHVINIESLIHQRCWSIAHDFLSYISRFLPQNMNKHFPILQHFFVDFSFDYICNLVIDAFHDLKLSIDDNNNTLAVFDYCQKKLLRTSSFDLPLILSLKSEERHPWIDQYYAVHSNHSLSSVVQQALKEKYLPHQVIYTYTQSFDSIENISINDAHIIHLNTFKTEVELTNRIKEHYQRNDGVRLLLLRLDYHLEHQHVLIVKHILLNSKIEQSDRGVWLICHLQRNLLNQVRNDVLFNGWSPLMINDLNDPSLLPKELLFNPSYPQLVRHLNHQLMTEKMFNELIDRCWSKFRYTIWNDDQGQEINRRRNEMIEYLSQPEGKLRKYLKKYTDGLVDKIIFPQYKDWRENLLNDEIIIGTCRSFNSALNSTISNFYGTILLLLIGHLEKYSLTDAFIYLHKCQSSHQKTLEEIWSNLFQSMLNNLDVNLIKSGDIEIPLIFGFHYPYIRMEYDKIRMIRQSIDERREAGFQGDAKQLSNSAIENLQNHSVFGSLIETIFNDKELFRWYYHDHLLLVQADGKLDGLSIEFMETLFLLNPMQTLSNHFKHFFVDWDELFRICRLFQIGFQQIDEMKFLQEVIKTQLVQVNDEQTYNNNTTFYQLILKGEDFYLVSPMSSSTFEEKFECTGDSVIEVSLMNLIEYLVSPSVINKIENIEELTTTYSLVTDGIINLNHYSVNNLEKLRSFLSLLRCIFTIVPSEKAAQVFQPACTTDGFDATFVECNEIPEFITKLKQIIINTATQSSDNEVVEGTLAKLESEFLKNWLVDNSNNYHQVLSLISTTSNKLWMYSAKMFSSIERNLEWLEMIETYQGRIPNTDDPLLTSDERMRDLLLDYERFNQVEDPQNALAQMLVTRLHMKMILSGQDPLGIVQTHWEQFTKNLQDLENHPEKFGIRQISLISWMKFYAQLYAVILYENQWIPELKEIDKILVNNNVPCCKTIKLFIIKQMCQMLDISLERLREIMVNRQVVWIENMIELPTPEQKQDVRDKLILPTPLFKHKAEFLHIDHLLTECLNIDKMRTLVEECRTNANTTYCFYMWFIHLYARFSMENNPIPANTCLDWIKSDLYQNIREVFHPLGGRFLILLCSNFQGTKNYFSLNPQMKPEDVHHRLVLLNLIALLLAYQSYFIFDAKQKVVDDYAVHIQKSVCLPGLLIKDPVVKQMIRVRHEVQQRLAQNEIHHLGKFIFQCSEKCFYTFYFVNCGVPVAQSKCPLCGAAIGAVSYGCLIERNPPQIKRTIKEAFDFIDRYLHDYNKPPRLGYFQTSAPNESHLDEKSEHLDRPISYRFMHFLTHSTLLFLNELGLLPNFTQKNNEFFREHVRKDYDLLIQQLSNVEQIYTWFYKLFNDLADKDVPWQLVLNTNQKVVEFEKYFEEKILFPRLQSVVNEVAEYKTMYTAWTQQENKKLPLGHFVSEMVHDEKTFPLLSFFNKTNILTKNPIEEFHRSLGRIPSVEDKYPVTVFIMKCLDDFSNIQHLYPIINFINYLIERFNHRIKRNEASEHSIEFYLKSAGDADPMKKLYEDFVNAWFQLKLDEVRFGCQTVRFKLEDNKENFASETKLAMFLLNISKDASSILLAACLRTVAALQNDIVNFFHEKILRQGSNQKSTIRKIHVQSIRREHVLQLDQNFISEKLITDGMTIDYRYGRSQSMIYDYEEIELTLRNLIANLPLIDAENFRCLNYQFELYSENTSLINDVRARIKQEPLTDDHRKKYNNLLTGLPNDDLQNYLGSLDYVFTYLRNLDEKTGNSSLPIQTFVEKYIRSSTSLNDNVVQRQPFAGIHLGFIIDLYELVEEIVFDKVIRHYVKPTLSEEAFPEEQRIRWINEFSKVTWKSERIAPSLQSFDPWINILKRLMVRVLSNTNISLDVPIQIYLERTDLWPGTMTIADIQTIEVPDEILLKHTFIILKGLEEQRKKKNAGIFEPTTVVVQDSRTQLSQLTTWRTPIKTNASQQRAVGSGGAQKKKR